MSISKKNLLLRVGIAVVFIPAMLFCFYRGGLYQLIGILAITFGLTAEFGEFNAISLRFWQKALLLIGTMFIIIIRGLHLSICVGEFMVIFSAAWFLLELIRRPTEVDAVDVRAFRSGSFRMDSRAGVRFEQD